MRALFVYETIHFERGNNPLDTLDIGSRVTITLCNGYEIEGFRRNKEKVMSLVKMINTEMKETYESNKDEGESTAMDARDEVIWKYVEQLKEYGFKIKEDND